MTDPGFADRMHDLIKYKPDFTINDIQLLKVGRHFRLAPEAKLIVGRNEKENNTLLNLIQNGDLNFYPVRTKGPCGIGRGHFNKTRLFTASSVIARYSDKDSSTRQLEIAYKHFPNKKRDSISALPIDERSLTNLRI